MRTTENYRTGRGHHARNMKDMNILSFQIDDRDMRMNEFDPPIIGNFNNRGPVHLDSTMQQHPFRKNDTPEFSNDFFAEQENGIRFNEESGNISNEHHIEFI